METAPRNCRFLSLVVVELVLNLGGNFGPEKKYLPSPPPISRKNPPGRVPPPPPPARETPPPRIFNKKSSQRFGLPLPLSRADKNKKYPKRPPSYTVVVLNLSKIYFRISASATAVYQNPPPILSESFEVCLNLGKLFIFLEVIFKSSENTLSNKLEKGLF